MRIFKTLIVILIACLVMGTGGEKLNGRLVVFHAGSLSVPFKKMAAEFNKEHPDVKILLEAAGSRRCARKIADLKKPCDVMASADYTVINQLLIPNFASWNIKLATNEMAIVYHKASRKSAEINADNWYKILLDKNITFGHSAPNADPCGYRSILTMKLAGKFYKDESITNRLLNKNNKIIRPKETDLLGLLESNALDYLFLYRSVARQHGLKYIILPNQINLKKADLADYYKTVSIKITGKNPGTFITKTGAPMVYGITIPKNPPNPRTAMAFVNFVLDEKGKKIMEECGQPSAVPSKSATFAEIPDKLKKYAKK